MEPSFKYIKNPDSGSSESVAIETKTVGEQNKEAEVIKKKRTKRYGSSLGWGWFQGFNLFIAGSLLLVCIVFAYFMMGGEKHHEGPPKYAIDRTNDLGKAVFNPVIPVEVRDTFVYKAPERHTRKSNKPDLGEIELISEAGMAPDLPALNLQSTDDATSTNTTPDAAPTVNDANFYGDAPFGKSMQELQLQSITEENNPTNAASNNPQADHLINQANIAWSRGQLSEPYQDSALSFYRRALDNDPDNQVARTGIDRLATHYLNLAKKSNDQGDSFSALDYVDLGLKADPLNPELNQLKSNLLNE